MLGRKFMLKRSLATLVIVLFVSVLGYSQMTVSGTVVDVIDGKTVLIELPNGKVRAEMLYIEVPEKDQELHDTVIDHLRKLTVGRPVTFRGQQILKDRTAGLLMSGDIDIAQQMLRDGAAWHVRHIQTGQTSDAAKIYETNEADARAERRGVWSIDGMKTAWQYRADLDAAANASVPKLVKDVPSERPQVKRPTGYWGDVNPKMMNVGALANGYNHAARSGFVGTSYLPVTETDVEAAAGVRTAVDVTYFYKEYEVTGRHGIFVFTIVSSGSKWRFLENNDLTVITDGKKFAVGKAKRTSETVDNQMVEKLTYTVDRKTIENTVNGVDVQLKVGKMILIPRAGMQMLLNNLLLATR